MKKIGIFFIFYCIFTFSAFAQKADSIAVSQNILLFQNNSKKNKPIRYLGEGEKITYKLRNNTTKEKGVIESIQPNSLTVSGKNIAFEDLQMLKGKATKLKFSRKTGNFVTAWGAVATVTGGVSIVQTLSGLTAIITPVLSAATMGAGLAGVFILGTPFVSGKKFDFGKGWQLNNAMIDEQGNLTTETTRPELITVTWKIKDEELASLVSEKDEVAITFTDKTGNPFTNVTQVSSSEWQFQVKPTEIVNAQIQAKGYEDTTIVLSPENFRTEAVEQEILLEPKKTTYQINITDIETDQEVELAVVLTNKNREERIVLDPNQRVDGKYNVQIRAEDSYELEIRTTDEYFFFAKEINTPAEREARILTSSQEGHQGQLTSPTNLDIKVTPLKIGAKVSLNNITFAKNSSELNSDAMRELDRVVDLLERYPNTRVEIGAHTDDKGTDADNLLLSEMRASSVLNYLQSKNIDVKSRCESKAYGASQPLVPNISEENRAINRRFEIKIIAL